MNVPVQIQADSFQTAWANAILTLKDNQCILWNLVVQIQEPLKFDTRKHEIMRQFAIQQKNIIEPNKIAYTIFPYKLYRPGITREWFYEKYWRYFTITRNMPHSGWGTYFERMIRYKTFNGEVDQLGSIIDNNNKREKTYQAAYVIIIPQPYSDINRIMGAPCLNYLTVQVEVSPHNRKVINLLAVYRNHDFRSRAYGNYFGLCKLMQYISTETNADVGMLTCISSHASIPSNKRELTAIANTFLEEVNNGL